MTAPMGIMASGYMEAAAAGGLTITPVARWQRTTGSAANVSSSFSVTNGGLIVCAIGYDFNDANPALATPSNTGTPFTWTRRAVGTASSRPTDAVWTAPVTATISTTISITASTTREWAKAWVITGQAASPIGVTGNSATQTGQNQTISYTASAAGSAMFVAAEDWNETGNITSSDLTLDNGDYTGWTDAAPGHRVHTSAGATSFHLTAGGASPIWSWAYCEIVP